MLTNTHSDQAWATEPTEDAKILITTTISHGAEWCHQLFTSVKNVSNYCLHQPAKKFPSKACVKKYTSIGQVSDHTCYSMYWTTRLIRRRGSPSHKCCCFAGNLQPLKVGRFGVLAGVVFSNHDSWGCWTARYFVDCCFHVLFLQVVTGYQQWLCLFE